MSLECKVRARVKELKSSIIGIKSPEQLVSLLNDLQKFLPNTDLSSQIGNKTQDQICESEIFMRQHYSNIALCLLDSISIETTGQLQKADFTNHFLGYFLFGDRGEAFLAITFTINKLNPGYKLNKCVSILEEFLTHLGLTRILEEQTGLKKPPDISLMSWKSDGRSAVWDALVMEIGALPDKMANKLKTEVGDIFIPKFYIPLVVTGILTTLTTVNKYIRLSKDCSLEFISRLVGKLCSCGYADLLWTPMLRQVSVLVRKDYIWSHMFETIITGVPDRCVESVLVPLVKQLPWYGLMDRFLGNVVMYKQKIQLILCTKLIFHRYFESVLVLQNIIGYLATVNTREHLFIKLIRDALQVWGDSSSYCYMSYQQHKYLTQAILICVGFLNEQHIQANKDELLRILMPGVQGHIGMSDVKLRRLGMIVGEVVTQSMDTEGPKLKFEYENDEEMIALKNLPNIPPDPFTDDVVKDIAGLSLEEVMATEFFPDSPGSVPGNCSRSEEKTENLDENHSKVPSDLDSDDDLEPYDMSNDTHVNKVKQPKYIRDCLEGLITCDKPDTVEVCLGVAESLIRSNPFGLTEISAEFAKVLLHMTESHGIPDFRALRFDTLVALTVSCPREVAEYLTSQFYDRNYSIRQRLDIIEVIGTAAQELSRPEDRDKKSNKPQQQLPKVQEVNTDDKTKHWKEIVQKRIESKTRRFAFGSKTPKPVAVENKFAPVAGYFFYPLMKHFDRQENTFDLLGEDCFVLSRLMYTLGIVIYAASNIPNIREMAACLLEFIWVLRFHSDASVRQGLLFAISMLYLTVPSHMLLNELQIEVLESKNWLEDVIDKDVDSQCKTLAVQALVLLENIIKQEFMLDVETT